MSCYSYVKRLWLRGGNSVKRNKPSLEHSFSALHSRYLQYYRRKYLNRLLTFSWWRSAQSRVVALLSEWFLDEWHWGRWTIHCLMRVYSVQCQEMLLITTVVKITCWSYQRQHPAFCSRSETLPHPSSSSAPQTLSWGAASCCCMTWKQVVVISETLN